jgi:enoyl-CoA hydratase/carnithine racemase
MGGPVPSATIDLPTSYTSLNTTQITVSHVPASSPIPTSVVLVTLNRPKNYNAFTKVMEEELVRVFEMFDLDDRVRCVVLNGAGKMFCAGADLDIGFTSQKETEREGEHRDGFVTSTPQLHPVC